LLLKVLMRSGAITFPAVVAGVARIDVREAEK